MGYGEMTGNGSVHWHVVHEDPATGAATRVIARGVESPRIPHIHKGDPETLRFGLEEVKGRDAISYEQIGTTRDPDTGRSKGHPGRFRIRIRFLKWGDAFRAGLAAALHIKRVGGQWVLQVDVPVVNRDESQLDPTRPPSEVRVDS